MIFGNQDKVQMIDDYLAHNSDSHKPIFLLIWGAEGIGKASFLDTYAKKILGDYYLSDFLWIKDFSETLGKTHVIPVGKSQNTLDITTADGTIYDNKGVREITSRLQQSGFSGKKILLIENIERMNIYAMNAFLKTAEEPLNNRIIFATSNNPSSIVNTLVSRAFLVHFNPLSTQEMEEFLEQEQIYFENTALKDTILEISAGRTRFLLKLKNIFENNPDILANIHRLMNHFSQPAHSKKKLDSLKQLHENGILELFIDTLIAQNVDHQTINIDHLITTKKLLDSNISLDNVLRYGIL